MELDRVQARWVLGLLPAETVPGIAGDWMVGGWVGPAVLNLASFDRPTREEIGEGFVAAMVEMGRSRMSARRAARILAREEAAAMARGEIDPWDGACRIRSFCDACTDSLPELTDLLERARAVEGCGDHRGCVGTLSRHPDRAALTVELVDAARRLSQRGIPPDPVDSERIQAQWVLGRIPWTDLPLLAADLVARGHGGPAVRRIASPFRGGPEEVEHAFSAAMAECGHATMTVTRATLVLAIDVARTIVRGEVDAYEGACEIDRLYRARDDGPKCLLEVVTLVAMFEDLMDRSGWTADASCRRAREEYQCKMVEEARKLVEQNP